MKKILLTILMCLFCTVSFADDVDKYIELDKVHYEICYINNEEVRSEINIIPVKEKRKKECSYLTTAKGLDKLVGNVKLLYKEDKVVVRVRTSEKRYNEFKALKNPKEIILNIEKGKLITEKMTPFKEPESELLQIVRWKLKQLGNILSGKAFAKQTYSDDFDGNDFGTKWDNIEGVALAVTDVGSGDYQAYVSSTSAPRKGWAVYDSAFDSDDQFSKVTAVTMTADAEIGVIARIEKVDVDGYECSLNDGDDRLHTYRLDDGVRTEIAYISENPTNGDTVKIEVDGTSIKLYRNDVEKDDTTDSTYSTGKYAGIYINRGAATRFANDWIGEDLRETAAGRTRRFF